MAPPPNLENVQSSKSSNSEGSSSPLLGFYFLTLFPEVFPSVLQSSLLGKAQKNGLVSYDLTQIRDFATDRHRTVDDTPYGGGEGMVLKADVLYAAWKAVLQKAAQREGRHGASGAHSSRVRTILLSPQGPRLDQDKAKELVASYSQFVLICGHYEGVDERVIDLCVDEEVSIGDYVLTGGELPALVFADTLTRLIPGVVGNDLSVHNDSLENGLLKYPQYTRPREFEGLSVPDVLMGGNHQQILAWRQQQSLERTQAKRPDLLEKVSKNPVQFKK